MIRNEEPPSDWQSADRKGQFPPRDDRETTTRRMRVRDSSVLRDGGARGRYLKFGTGEQRARARERGYGDCPGARRTRQNRTTVNGSSLQSSYFLMMAGRYVGTCACAGDSGRVGSLQENHEAEPQNRSVPYCSTSVGRALLSPPPYSANAHRRLGTAIETTEHLRPPSSSYVERSSSPVQPDFSIDPRLMAV